MTIKTNADVIKRMMQEIDAYIEEAETLRLKIEAKTLEMQELCPHPSECLREGERSPAGIIFRASPPFRVCIRCGYAEEGRSYLNLGNDYSEVPTLSRDNARKLVLGMIRTCEELSEMRYPKKEGE